MAHQTHLDDMITAAKQELDAARRDGDATRICRAVAVLDGRLDRRIRETTQTARENA